MDVNIPVMGGLEMMRQICKVIADYKLVKFNLSQDGRLVLGNIQIVALTANDDKAER